MRTTARTSIEAVTTRALGALGALCALCALGAVPSARAQVFPDDAQWIVLECGDVPSFDAVGDEPGAVDERDVVGDAAQPALYYFADADFLYLRMRVDADPIDRMELRPFSWAAELDVDFVASTYELLAAADGVANPDEVVLAENTVQRALGDPADPPERDIATYPGRTHARGVAAAGALASSFGGDPDFFVDWAIPLADLATVGVVDTSAIQLVMGTSSSTANGIDADIACHDGAGVGATLVEVFTDPVTPTGVVVVDTDGDGFPDSVEVRAGTDPNDPASFPGAAAPGTDAGPVGPGRDAGPASGLGLRGGRAGCSATGTGEAGSGGALALALVALGATVAARRRRSAGRRADPTARRQGTTT